MAGTWQEAWTKIADLSEGGQGLTSIVERKADSSMRGVMKLLKKGDSPKSRGRFRQEAVNLEIVGNAGGAVPRVIEENSDRFNEAGNPELFLIMEEIKGQTLANRIAKAGCMTLDAAAAITLSILDTIAIGHEQNVLHRDLKPENIMVDEAGKAVLLDYGISFNKTTPSGLTEFNEQLKNSFLALPETSVPGGSKHEPESDLAAICAILLFCLTNYKPAQLRDGKGKLPHRRPETDLTSLLKSDPRRVHLDSFFSRGFADDIANRFPTAIELKKWLQAALDQTPWHEVEDLHTAADRLYHEIRTSDRGTQLREYGMVSERAVSKIERRFRKEFDNKIGTKFHVATQINGEKGKFTDADAITGRFQIQINADGRNYLRRLDYTFGAKGDQCGIFASRTARNGDVGNEPLVEQMGPTAVVWYTATEEPHDDVIEAIAQHAKAQLLIMMRDLTDVLVAEAKRTK